MTRTALDAPLQLLGGLSPAQFMRRHWQKRPLLVRQAWPGVQPPLARRALFDLAAGDGVESRLVEQRDGRWRVRQGPLARRSLPPVSRPGWTLLVQGLDLHVAAAHDLLEPFRFIPAARLDDLMLSWASPGGGVGPHLDSYDVFLLQVQGARRWRVAPTRTAAARAFMPGLPLKILQRFEPTQSWLLEPGDMLYLPPGWAHDGVAEGGECMTASVGFRAPARGELVRELLQRLGDEAGDAAGAHALYTDAGQPACEHPAALPPALVAFARAAALLATQEPGALERALGEFLSEPKSQVWFNAGASLKPGKALRLDARTRLLHDARHLFVNGEAFEASGRDGTLLRRLADRRRLPAADVARLSEAARRVVDDWCRSGWLHSEDTDDG